MTSPKITESQAYVRNGRHPIQQQPGNPSEESPSGLPCQRLPQKLLGLPHRNCQPHQHRNHSSTNVQPSSRWPRRQQGLEAGRDLRYRALVALYLGKKKVPLERKNSGKNPERKTRGARSFSHLNGWAGHQALRPVSGEERWWALWPPSGMW